jgi:hypothetical protein
MDGHGGLAGSRTLLFYGLDRSHPEAVRKMLRDICLLGMTRARLVDVDGFIIARGHGWFWSIVLSAIELSGCVARRRGGKTLLLRIGEVILGSENR